MQINVSQQLKSPIGTARDYDIDSAIDILDTGVSSPVKGKVKLTRTNRGILVQGTLDSSVPVECGRCLSRFDCPLNVNIEEEFFPSIDVNSGAPVEIPEDSSGFTIDEHHILDLREPIRQNALLAVPMKPLCREDCAGLCAQCGKDLNQGQCRCERTPADPRWSRLAELAATARKNRKRKKETE